MNVNVDYKKECKHLTVHLMPMLRPGAETKKRTHKTLRRVQLLIFARDSLTI